MRWPLPFLVVVLLATACGDDGNDGATPDSPSSTTTTEAAIAPADTTTTTTEAVPTPPPAVPIPPASTIEGILGLPHPIVAGHAGGDQAWPKSTMFAFREAARAGTHVLEMDVQLTGDGVLVVHHDDTVDRTSGTTGRLRDLTYNEVRELDHAYWWSTEWSSHDLPADRYVYRGIRTGEVAPPEGYGPDDFKVETFRAVAEAFPDHVLDVEIKIPDGDDGDDLEFAIEGARVLADEIEALDRTDSVIVVSFNDDVMAAFHEFAPDVITSPGTTATFSWLVGSAELHPNDRVLQLPPEFNDVDVLGIDGLLPKAAAEGLAIWVWPNDARSQENPDFYVELIDLGVQGVIAGHPDLAMERFRAEGLVP